MVPSFLFHILMWTVQEKLHSETNFKTRDWVFVFLPHEPRLNVYVIIVSGKSPVVFIDGRVAV